MRREILTRRGFVLSTLALAGCQTTGASVSSNRALTSEYDGDYEIVVSRLWNPTPNNLKDPYYRKEPEELAFIWARVENGRFNVKRVGDKSAGSNYKDFNAAFYDGGVFELSTTVGYLVGKPSPYKLNTSASIGSQLLGGGWVTFEPKSGFDSGYRPHIGIRKTG